MTNEKPHDSAFVYSSTKGKHWLTGFSSLQEKEPGRGEFVILALLMILMMFGTSFGGFLLQTQVVNPPKQVLGVCPPPAYILGDNCYTKTTTIDAQGNTHIIVSPAGSIVGALSCTANQCVSNPNG